MSTTSSRALTKRATPSSLMPPPPAPKRIKRPAIVLDEDTYTSAVSHIIRRDFFPGLEQTDAQLEYLDAVESRDKRWIKEAGRKLGVAMTPVAGKRKGGVAGRTRFGGTAGAGGVDKTPSVWGNDTPVSVAETEGEEELGKLDGVDLDMSLGAFQAKYTSEDQESFSQIIDKQNRTRFDKNVWVREGNKFASKQRIAQQKVIEARAAAAITNGNGSKELVLSSRPSQDLDDRPAAPDTHRHTALNTLMFNPDSIESWAPTRAGRADDASLAPPKQIRHNNTRLPPLDTAPARSRSPTLSAVRDAVAGRPRASASEAEYLGSETPRVNGYAFVDAHPPEPDSDSDSSENNAPTDLLQRYGIGASSKATPFSIADPSAREEIAGRMVDKINASRSGKTSTNASSLTPAHAAASSLGIFPSSTPRFLSAPTPARGLGAMPGRREKGGLTPAAQRLFERVGSTPRVSSGGFGEERNGGWTPVVRGKRKG